jgi:GxxExxY protein
MTPRTEQEVLALCDKIRAVCLSLHAFLRHGHPEKVYENGLAHRLRRAGIQASQQHLLTVRDEDGTVLGDYAADLLVENALIMELKACDALCNAHVAQLLGYLRGTGIRDGLLVNFGSPVIQIRKYRL